MHSEAYAFWGSCPFNNKYYLHKRNNLKLYPKTMRQQLEQRLQALKAELASGQKVLAELEMKQTNVRDTLLRISGAIQVIEEELAEAASEENHTNGLASSNGLISNELASHAQNQDAQNHSRANHAQPLPVTELG